MPLHEGDKLIIEAADIRIHPGQQLEFERAVKHGLDTVLSKAEGFLSYEVRHSLESPERYLLLIRWNTLEDHTVGFRSSSAHETWRSIVGPYFAQAPMVEHFSSVAESF
jgi:heme-degrading monooxygenase HmoA